MAGSTILVLDTDPTSGQQIASIISASTHDVIVVTDADAAVARAGSAQLLVVATVPDVEVAHDVCRRIRSTPDLGSMPILRISATDEVEERIACLEAGADDVMARPFDARELEARLEALLLRAQRGRQFSGTTAPSGPSVLPVRRTVAVFSPKGGAGTTTIATNVAVVAAERRPDRVVLIDLDVQFGQAATLLNLNVRQSVGEMARDPGALREPDLLRTYALRHESGLNVLAAPISPELASLVEPTHVEQILENALQTYDSVVIDAGAVLDDRSMVILERADAVLLPIYPEISALKAARSVLDYLSEVSSVASRTTLVLNAIFAREILSKRDVEGALGTKVGLELPYDPFLYLKAANEGIPIVIGAPRSKPAERLRLLAAMAFGEEPEAADAGAGGRRGSRIPSLLRRS